jgi:ParB-like chromosome segregation protein Spo0J
MGHDKAATAAPKAVKVGKRTFTLPFADLLPELSEREMADLREGIRRDGVITPVIVDEHDSVIDGAHRVTIAAEVGLTDVPVVVRTGLSHAQKTALALSLNADRRHMSPETIKRLKAKRVKRVAAGRRQGKSTRQIAEEEGISQSQVVADLKTATEQGCSVEPQEGKVSGKDGKKRRAARKPKPRKPSVAQRLAAETPSEPAAATAPGTSSDGGGGLEDVRADLESLACDQSALTAIRFVAASLLGERSEKWRAVWRQLAAAAGESIARFEASLTLELQAAAARKSTVDAASMALAALGEEAGDENLKEWVARRWPGIRLRLKDVARARQRLKRAADRR